MFFFITNNIVFSQDIHFSQFMYSPLNLNPALTGDFDGDYRFIANHRNQWSSITVPYVSFSAGFDILYSHQKLGKTKLGGGLLFNTDKAGDGNFGTNQVILSASAIRPLNDESTINIALGANVAYNQNSVDYNKFYFGNQYNGYQFDSSLPNDEYFVKDNLSYFDFSLGIASEIILSGNKIINAGFSFMHINSPQKSFYDSKNSELPGKFNFFGNISLPVFKKHRIIPQVVYFRQGTFNELYLGGEFAYSLNNLQFKNLYLSLLTRLGDAAIIRFGLDYKSWNMGISYDINYSKLTVVSSGRGGYELSIRYIIKKAKAINIPFKTQCPEFL